MLKILDQYIVLNFIRYFLISFLGLLSLSWILTVAEILLRKNAAITTVVVYVLHLTPNLVAQALPLACIIAIALLIKIMEEQSELLALHSMGISLFTVFRSVLLLTALISVSQFVSLGFITPKSNYLAFQYYHTHILKKKTPDISIGSEKIWYKTNNFIFNFKHLNNTQNTAYDIIIYDIDDKLWKINRVFRAKRASFLSKKEWLLHEGQEISFAPNKNKTHPQKSPNIQLGQVKQYAFKTKQLILELNAQQESFNSSIQFHKYMNNLQIQKFIKNNESSGLDVNLFKVELYSRYIFATISFIIVFLFIPLGVSALQRRGQGYMKPIGGVLLGLLYWIIYSLGVSLSLARGNSFWIWIPWVLFLLFALWSWKKFFRYQASGQTNSQP